LDVSGAISGIPKIVSGICGIPYICTGHVGVDYILVVSTKKPG
jgi:hypothetical protein